MCKECKHCDSHGHHDHAQGEESKTWLTAGIALAMLAGGLVMNATGAAWFQNPTYQFIWYFVTFLEVGKGVMKEAWEGLRQRDFFNEFTLMTIASIGAFCIGEYPEGLAVMLFYYIGEMLQDRAVDRARDNIQNLIAMTPDKARLINPTTIVAPSSVCIGDIIEVLPGERVPLDGILLEKDAAFNTAALTGESIPQLIRQGKEVLAGMIVQDAVVHLQVVRESKDSAMSRILQMVQDANERKAPAEQFVHRFAKVYTPVVIALAVLVAVLPWLYSLVSDFAYSFNTWFYRALVFLVISCPCALVISIPLSYFAGIGKASTRGILFKGGNYLDAITRINTVVFDKTGTLTTGEFAIQHVEGVDLTAVAAIERNSNHPIAQAICRYASSTAPLPHPEDITDLPGFGLSATLNGDKWLVGTLHLLEKEHIPYPEKLATIPETIVVCARNGQYEGYILLADTLKPDAAEAVSALRNQQIENIDILSGDKQALIDQVVSQLGVDHGHGDLLPQDKVAYIEKLKEKSRVAFVGDGINDAPVLALSDVGIAMGGLGADMAIETADVVIQNDQPSRVAEAISIGKRTRRIVHQNIAFALGIKVLVMLLGVLGIANMWMAVFADVGVALLCVLNAMRVFLYGKRWLQK